MMSSDYNFSSFLTDRTNGAALISAILMAEYPQSACECLWIYGDSGCGKSHLLKSIYQTVNANTDKSVKYMDADEVVRALLAGMLRPTPSHWSSPKECELLVIDNMEAIAGRIATQIEFARMIRDKIKKGHRVVISTNCHPRNLSHLYKIWLSEFEDALVVGIDNPSAQLLRRYANMIVDRYKIDITQEAVELLARSAPAFPHVTGALTTAHFMSERLNTRIDLRWMQSFIKNFER